MQNVKGTYDVLGREQALRRKVLGLLEETFESYDFNGMESTILNELELYHDLQPSNSELNPATAGP